MRAQPSMNDAAPIVTPSTDALADVARPAETAGTSTSASQDPADAPAPAGQALGKGFVALVGIGGLVWGYSFGAQLSGAWLGVATAIGTALFGVLLADSLVDVLARAAARRSARQG